MKKFISIIILCFTLTGCKFFETPEAKTFQQDIIKAADVVCVMAAETTDVDQLMPLCGIIESVARFLVGQKYVGADRVAIKRGGYKHAY